MPLWGTILQNFTNEMAKFRQEGITLLTVSGLPCYKCKVPLQLYCIYNEYIFIYKCIYTLIWCCKFLELKSSLEL